MNAASTILQAPQEAPEAGAVFEYGLDSFGKSPARYRVTGWMRQRAPKMDAVDFAASGALPTEYGGLGALWASECVREILEEEGAKRCEPMEFCLREFATHVSGAGIAGCIAPLSRIKVTGMVAWDEGALRQAQAHAHWLAMKSLRDDC